ncbi:hypothetical protein TSAR_012426 [Trichomalopsis sarcophagae]|uniref:Uncharacterized protein n=1 Tax=Trichomalopsis sarcophagae TaxID=543379 RepID=A0A232F834_9HYME|nr:hypothetical protein TSAR_012426 [Trichomalopsis sarcophagae]
MNEFENLGVIIFETQQRQWSVSVERWHSSVVFVQIKPDDEVVDTMFSSNQKQHAPWKLHKIISDNVESIRCCTVEQHNRFFLTGSDDGVIKFWDLDSGILKTAITNAHSGSIRGLGISPLFPHFYSCGEGGQLKCWDVEYNKMIHEYKGHASTVNSLVVNYVLTSVGRDCSAKSWDLKSNHLIHTYRGHIAEVLDVVYRNRHADLVTSSHDCTIRTWELTTGIQNRVLINHRKSVKALSFNPNYNEIVSASQDSIKKWTKNEKLIQNLPKRNADVNCLAVNQNDVLVSGTDDGTMQFWDWRSGYNFQTLRAPVHPGIDDSKTDIFSVTFDKSGTKLITTGASKMIHIYTKDETASEENFLN